MAIPVSIINVTRTLRELWLHPGISRVELAALLSMNKSSITKIVQDLIDGGMVIPGDEGLPGPQGGRKPVALNLNPRFGYLLGVEVNEETVRIVCLDFTGEEVFSREETLPPEKTDLTGMVRFAIDLAVPRIPLDMVLGAAVAVPGVVDAEKGIIRQSIPLGISRPFPLLYELKEYYPFPLYLENDANCCCWGEISREEDLPLRNFLYILGEMRKTTSHEGPFPTGPVFGLGLALRGTVFHGEDYSAGEFRSIFNRNYSSCQLDIPPEDRSRFLTDPDLRRRALEELARNIALVVNVLNLNRVVLGGFFHSFRESYEDLFLAEILKNNSYPELAGISVALSRHGSFGVPFGAASYVLEKLYNISGQFGSEFLTADPSEGSLISRIIRTA